jgi:hypothetical protein
MEQIQIEVIQQVSTELGIIKKNCASIKSFLLDGRDPKENIAVLVDSTADIAEMSQELLAKIMPA